MPTVSDVAKRLGLSERAVRLRVDALRPTVDGYLQRGPNGQVILTDGAWSMLERLEALRQADGITVNAAGEVVRRELSDGGNGQRQPTSTPEAEALRLVLDERAKRIAQLEAEVEYLRERLAEMMPLALPARTGILPRVLAFLRRS